MIKRLVPLLSLLCLISSGCTTTNGTALSTGSIVRGSTNQIAPSMGPPPFDKGSEIDGVEKTAENTRNALFPPIQHLSKSFTFQGNNDAGEAMRIDAHDGIGATKRGKAFQRPDSSAKKANPRSASSARPVATIKIDAERGPTLTNTTTPGSRSSSDRVDAAPVGATPGSETPSVVRPAPPTTTEQGSDGSIPSRPTTDTRPKTNFVVPTVDGLGLAAYRVDDVAVFVFDQAISIGTTQLRDLFGAQAISIQQGSNSTVLSVPWPRSQPLNVQRGPEGWIASPEQEGATLRAIEVKADKGKLALSFRQPGKVLTILDPITGHVLLVGTASSTTSAGQRLIEVSRLPEATLFATSIGVVVEPTSDQVDMRVTPEGFAITLNASGLEPVVTTALTSASTQVTRLFDLPALSIPAQRNRLMAHLTAAAAEPVRSRGQGRLAVAQDLVGLGMAHEAQAVLALALAEDPTLSQERTTRALYATAAILAGRSAEAMAIDDTQFDSVDEAILWRNVRDIGAGRADRLFGLGTSLRIADGYPDVLKRRILPMLVEAAIAAGEIETASKVMARQPDDLTLGLAKASLLEHEGKLDESLHVLDDLAGAQDRLMQTVASARAAEMRLAAGKLTPAEASDVLDRHVLAWRGDRREVQLRLRVAELRTQAGRWRQALDGLREVERLEPRSDAVTVQARVNMQGTILALLRPDAAPVSAIDFVVIASEFADVLAEGGGDPAFNALLADKLIALDLSSRARPLLETLVAATPSGIARAGFGLKLANILLDANESAEAGRVISVTDAADLPPQLRDQRSIAGARARAAQGDVLGASSLLETVDTAAADRERAELWAGRKQWPEALRALTALAEKVLPPEGALEPGLQDLVLQIASAAVQAGDPAVLGRLMARDGSRLDASRAKLFQLLTAAPINSPADLPRAGREIALARALPDSLQSSARP